MSNFSAVILVTFDLKVLIYIKNFQIKFRKYQSLNENLKLKKNYHISWNVKVTKSGNKISRDLKIVTLNQVWPLYQVSLNQVKLALQKPAKIWDQTNLDVKSEMSLKQVTKRR